MMSPQLAAALTAFVGACLVAGWATGFRNRSYVGWLGAAFIALAVSLWGLGQVRAAQEVGAQNPRMALLSTSFFFACIVCFLLAAVSAVREAAHRLREMRAHHEEAAETMLAMIRASREREEEPHSEERDDGTQDEGGT